MGSADDKVRKRVAALELSLYNQTLTKDLPLNMDGAVVREDGVWILGLKLHSLLNFSTPPVLSFF